MNEITKEHLENIRRENQMGKGYPKHCSKCKKKFKENDFFYYDILDDSPELNDLCKKCAKPYAMMGKSRIMTKRRVYE